MVHGYGRRSDPLRREEPQVISIGIHICPRRTRPLGPFAITMQGLSNQSTTVEQLRWNERLGLDNPVLNWRLMRFRTQAGPFRIVIQVGN